VLGDPRVDLGEVDIGGTFGGGQGRPRLLGEGAGTRAVAASSRGSGERAAERRSGAAVTSCGTAHERPRALAEKFDVDL
jgi:hypothetical protein